ncbi:MAG: hypothetical protein M1820_010851 [Bogoriella megaspora]|nr:MAG: hypothetical protein M1820_010851 [Bogoriella megaspora]
MMTAHLDNDNDGGPTQAIVRQFSDIAKAEMPEDDLVKSLAAKENDDEEKKKQKSELRAWWYSLRRPSAFTTDRPVALNPGLQQASDDLFQAWNQFETYLPDEQRIKFETQPPCLADIWAVVNDANEHLQRNRKDTKIGKFKERFTKLCNTLENHKNLFAIVPQGDKYACIFVGSVSAIVKAATNYEKITDTLTNVLGELSDRMPFWQRQLDVHRGNAYMARYATLLYVAIFKFLADIMNWFRSSWHRLRVSFNNDFVVKRLDTMESSIQRLSENLEKEAKLATESRVQNIPNTEDWKKMMESFMDEWFRRLGENVQGQLRSTFEDRLRLEYTAATQPLLTLRTVSSSNQIQDEPGRVDETGRQRLMMQLEKDYQQDRIQRLSNRSRALRMNFEVARRVQQWFQAPVSTKLWVYDQFQVPQPSRTTLLSAYVVSIAQASHAPVLAYFCDRQQQPTDPEESPAVLLSLLNSLLYQALKYSPAFTKILDPGRYSESSQALNLLQEVLNDAPKLVFIVIDGIQLLPTSVQKHDMLRNILQILDADRPGRRFKTLFTTDGASSALMHLRGAERLDLSSGFYRSDEPLQLLGGKFHELGRK